MELTIDEARKLVKLKKAKAAFTQNSSYTPSIKEFEEEMELAIVLFKKGLIPHHTQAMFKDDNVLIDNFVTQQYVVSISNLFEDSKKNQNTYLRVIFVHKGYRNNGIGNKMLNTTIQACQQLNINAIETEPLSKRSTKFFTKNGFKKMHNTKKVRYILNLKHANGQV